MMMGRTSRQQTILSARHQYLDFVGRETIYGYLAENRDRLFRDEQFAELYCKDNGRPSVPPSLAAAILFLRAFEQVSFVEAINRTKYDIRWKVALNLEMEEEPIQKSALQEFEARLVLHEKGEEMIRISIQEARRSGYLKSKKIRVALDTTPILGRGAVKDTYNLLADGIEKLMRTLAEVSGEEIEVWSKREDFSRYLESSIKGQADIDWTDQRQKDELLRQIVSDGKRLLALAAESLKNHPVQAERIATNSALLQRLLRQDVEEAPDGGVKIKQGTEKDRIVSMHDPEMRHGRKSSSHRFDGHKAAVATDIDSQLITAVEVIAGNAGDQEKALDLVEQSERVAQAKVEETVGDCAYGGGPTRQEFEEQGRKLTAKVPNLTNGDFYSKQDFQIDLDKMQVRCPAGKVTSNYQPVGKDRAGRFTFSLQDCQPCPLRDQCVKGKRARTISIQPQERLQQQARLHNQTPEGKEILRARVVVEHRIARLVRLGVRKSRYFGRKKTRFQLIMAAVVANLTLVAGFLRNQPMLTPISALITSLLPVRILQRLKRTLNASGRFTHLFRAISAWAEIPIFKQCTYPAFWMRF
jgi:hypothetical protein